jgi:hypothetical protein
MKTPLDEIDVLPIPPEVRARLTERSWWLAGIGWLLATWALWEISSFLHDHAGAAFDGVFLLGAIFWPIAGMWFREWLAGWLHWRALLHHARHGRWP